MDKNSENKGISSEAAASPMFEKNVLPSDSKNGKDSQRSEKVSQAFEPIEDDEEDLLLCNISDTEAFGDISDVKESPKKTEASEKSEKYFSDIESSDDSQVYEPISDEIEVLEVEKTAVHLEKEKKAPDAIEDVDKHKESEKVIELELEPVESEEEEFDETLPVKKVEEKQLEETVAETSPVEVCKELAGEIVDKKETQTPAEKEVETCVQTEKTDTNDKEIILNAETLDSPKNEGNSSKDTCLDTKSSEEESDKLLEIAEDEPLEIASDTTQVSSSLELKEKPDVESSINESTGQEDETKVTKVVDVESDKKEENNETVEMDAEVEDPHKNLCPLEHEILEESEKAVEKTEEQGNLEVEGEVSHTTAENQKTSVENDFPDKVDSPKLEKEIEKLDENVLQSTEDVSKDPRTSSSQSEPSENLVSTSAEEPEIHDSNLTRTEIPEVSSSQIEEPSLKETDEVLVISDIIDPKEKIIELEDALDSDKAGLEESVKGEDKTEIKTAEEDTVVENEDKVQGTPIQKEAENQQNSKATEENIEENSVESPPSTKDVSSKNSEENKVEPESEKNKIETKPTELQSDLSLNENISTQPESTDEPNTIDHLNDAEPPTTEDTDQEVFDEDFNLKDKLTTKVSEMMKTIDTSSMQGLTSDDDESLLVIDTTHKEDNDNEDNDVDTETEQTAATASTTDSSSDGSLEIFYHKECSNYDCSHGCKNFYRAPLFALSYYKVSKKRYKPQFVCEDCYDQALHAYEEMCTILKQKQPLYGANFKRQDFVEIIDSSDEEDMDGNVDSCKDENTFPKESIEFLENELEGIIRNVMQNVDIQNQLSWTKQVLQQSLERVKEDASYVTDQLQQLQKKADNMHNSLYQCPSIKIRQLTPLDLNSGRSYSPESESTIPASGEIERPSIQLNETYYAVKNKAIASWVPCKVIEEVEDAALQTKNLKHFKIKFLKSKYPMLKTLSAKHMAYFDPPRVRLPIGTRVIAYFDATSLSRGKEKMLIPSAFYPGIIAEPLKMSNKFRYLVFYDDGYFQYVSYKDVRLVCHASENVWDDVHHQSRDFIQNYLTQYTVNRPMVQTQKGQCMLVDYNGKWVYARVVDVDCSLVQMMFEGQSRSEWIYRGSTRLGPVYKESNNIAPKTNLNQSRLSRRTEPFIRYFNDEDSSSSQSHSQSQQQHSKSGEVRSVAKKSVSRADSVNSTQPVPVVKHLNNSTIFVDDDNKPKGKVVYYTARKNLPPRDFVPHICGSSCPFVITHNLQFYSPLAKPLLSGWERQVFRQKSKKFIVYRGPCGKRLRTMDELHRYLRVTKNELNVDNFDFSSETNCLAEYVIESCIVQKKDISNGEEKMPIPCVNYYDNTMPPDCKYSSRRIPTEGVHLNLDPDFLVGCDCEDDCSDKSKCSCWQLTYAGAKYSMPNVPHEMVGYQYKRLYAHVPTGIYECNSRCKCKANCVNRVVQQSLQSKLQVFKTSNRGWGLRCINDVPRGSFICIYAGHLLTEQKANEGGLDAGDEYFAELDYIEVAEQIKEGYESDVLEPDEEEEMYNPEKDDDDDEFVAPGDPHRNKSISTRLSTRRSTKNSSDAEHDSQERQVISFEPNKSQGRPSSATERPTMRRLFGKDEGSYIMDAKVTGNLGRYFNHSCSPNLFVQNVFVDTHDLRFPWVAFFAFSHIRAGTELTWNYNYEVGVVPGKVLYCQCGAPNCRQRLL